jgi:hypothetical protein
MTNREQLIQELEQAPEALVEELLDFYLFIKQRRGSITTDSADLTLPNRECSDFCVSP